MERLDFSLRCSAEECWHEPIVRNQQAILLGKDETSQQYIFRVWHACAEHLFYYTRTSGEELYQHEKHYGQGRMFFLVTPQHLALARRLWIVWYDGENGAPGASTRRPYGNSGVLEDVAEIIGYRQPNLEEDECYTPEERRYLEGLHHEMHLVLQIILHTGQMKPGVNHIPRLGEDWLAVEDPEQEQELVLASSPDQVPQPRYKWSKLHRYWSDLYETWWQGFEDDW